MTAPIRLHFEPRPWTSPCFLCGADLPSDHGVTLAASDRDAVCDGCAAVVDPQAAAALPVLREIDAAWWRNARGDRSLAPDGAASTYLHAVASGVAALVEFYGVPESSAASR